MEESYILYVKEVFSNIVSIDSLIITEKFWKVLEGP